jgi:hypothetical protein
MENFEKREIKNELSEEILRDASLFYEEGRISKKISPETASLFIQEIDRMLEYQGYFQEGVQIEKMLDALSSLEESSDNEQRIVIDFLKQTILDIRELNHRYKNIVQRMDESAKINKFRLEPAEFQDKQIKYDKDRKSCHDNILSNLNILRRYIKEVLPEKFNIHLDQDLVFPFSEDQMREEKRDHVGRWSRISAIEEELKSYREELSSITNDSPEE